MHCKYMSSAQLTGMRKTASLSLIPVGVTKFILCPDLFFIFCMTYYYYPVGCSHKPKAPLGSWRIPLGALRNAKVCMN